MIWNTPVETMSRDEMRALQSERLCKLVHYVYERVPFYRAKMDAAGVAIATKISTLLFKIPFIYAIITP